MKKKWVLRLISLSCCSFLACSNGTSEYTGPKNTFLLDCVNGYKETVSVKQGSTINDLVVPSKRGCLFSGWADGNTNEALPLSTEIQEGMTIKATWKVDQETMFEMPSNPSKRSEGTDVRIFSFNVLCDDYNNKPKMHGYDEYNKPYPSNVDDGRDYQHEDTIFAYMPDIICLQEFDKQWYEAYESFYNRDDFPYRPINESMKVPESGSDTLYTTICYNVEEVELLETFYVRYSNSDNPNCRFFVYGVFEHIQSGKEFIVANTHWNLITSSASNKDKQAKETASLIQDALTKYEGLPLFFCGDFNNIDSDASIQTLQEQSDLLDAKYENDSYGLLCDTYHIGNGNANEPDKWYRGEPSMIDALVNTIESRDHIFYIGNAKCLHYDTITDTRTLNSSDHMPIYGDFKI